MIASAPAERHRREAWGGPLRPALILPLLALLLPPPLSGFAQDLGELAVFVRDANRPDRTIVRAEATLVPEGARIAGEPRGQTRQTGVGGEATFRELEAGTYRLTVQAPGYVSATVGIRIPAETEVEVLLAPRALTLDEVVATANPLRSGAVYTAAQTFDRENLSRRLDASVGSMLDGEPGVAIRSLGAAATRPVIRGFDGDRILVLENGERMGDVGESAADHAVALDPLAMERIEVVRGPASLLYGSGALGGVVNLTTRDLPRVWSRGWEGAIQAQAASMNRSASGSGFFLYGTGDWATTARFSAREAGDIRTPEGRIGDTGITGRDGALGVVRQANRIRLGLSASFVDRTYGIPEEWDDPDEEVFITMERQALHTALEWEPASPGRLHGVEWRSSASRFFQQEIEREFRADGTVDEDVELEYDALSLSSTATVRHGSLGFFSEGAFGVALRARQMEIGGDEAFTPGIGERSLGIFTFHEAALSPDLTLQVGTRIEENRNQARPNDAFPGADQRRNATALSGSVGLNWRPGAGWEAGVQMARAHRVPLVEELYADGPHLGAGVFEIGSAELADEVSHGADFVLRRDFARLSVEAAGFATWIRDYIAFQPLGRLDEASGLPVFEYQGTNARMHGGEVSAEMALDDLWRTGLGVDWVQGTRADGSGGPLPSIPPLRGRFRLGLDPGPWWAGATLQVVATQNRVAPDERPTDGYALLDAQVGLRVGPQGAGTVILRMDNALNTRYRDHLSRLPERDLLMPGRDLSLLLRWAF